jgi:hypothetical protein
MALDTNEKLLIEKLTEALILMDADQQDIRTISEAKEVDEEFLIKAGQIFDQTEACDVCLHAFHSWRNTVDDETLLSFIDDWINWKQQNKDPYPQARIVKMKNRS